MQENANHDDKKNYSKSFRSSHNAITKRVIDQIKKETRITKITLEKKSQIVSWPRISEHVYTTCAKVNKKNKVSIKMQAKHPNENSMPNKNDTSRSSQ